MRHWMLVLSLLALPAHAAELLRVGVSSGIAAPFAQANRQGGCPGLVEDIAKTVATSLGWRLQCTAIQRERTETALAIGEIDVIAYYHPDWAGAPDRLVFSKPLFRVRDRLIAHSERASTIDGESALRGLRVGALSGFVYPRLRESFNRRRSIRVDFDSASSSLQWLQLSRVDALVLNEASFLHAQANNTQLAREMAMAPWVIAEDEIYWAFHAARGAAKRDRLLAALTELENSGVLARLRSRYPGVYPPR